MDNIIRVGWNALGAAYLVAVSWIVVALVPNTTVGDWTFLTGYIVASLIAGLHIWLATVKAPIGSVVVVTWFGGRLGLDLPEGIYLFPALLFLYGKVVDVRIRRARITRAGGTMGREDGSDSRKIDPISDMTLDRVRAFAEMAWVFRTIDPSRFLSVEDAFSNAISAVDAATRDIIRILTADEVATLENTIFVGGGAIQRRVGNNAPAVNVPVPGVLAALNTRLAAWGLQIQEFFLHGIRFTDAVEEHREREYKERQQQAAEQLEFSATKGRVDTIIEQGVEAPEAWENEMARQGKPLRDSVSIRTRGGDLLNEFIGRVTAGWRMAHGERVKPEREEGEE